MAQGLLSPFGMRTCESGRWWLGALLLVALDARAGNIFQRTKEKARGAITGSKNKIVETVTGGKEMVRMGSEAFLLKLLRHVQGNPGAELGGPPGRRNGTKRFSRDDLLVQKGVTLNPLDLGMNEERVTLGPEKLNLSGNGITFNAPALFDEPKMPEMKTLEITPTNLNRIKQTIAHERIGSEIRLLKHIQNKGRVELNELGTRIYSQPMPPPESGETLPPVETLLGKQMKVVGLSVPAHQETGQPNAGGVYAIVENEAGTPLTVLLDLLRIARTRHELSAPGIEEVAAYVGKTKLPELRKQRVQKVLTEMGSLLPGKVVLKPVAGARRRGPPRFMVVDPQTGDQHMVQAGPPPKIEPKRLEYDAGGEPLVVFEVGAAEQSLPLADVEVVKPAQENAKR